ncbi:hypothetical protein AB6E94_19360 [Vibrio lentus]|uniref:hypothetical protein n=1 Tax=Vibrio splendidus TaxID=29497 RepID=UPI000C867740|nr:hypothetical protein [Vibrio splendidus]PMG17859.1 hypothetical protein BCU98_00570 [Vibrio splendidus]
MESTKDICGKSAHRTEQPSLILGSYEIIWTESLIQSIRHWFEMVDVAEKPWALELIGHLETEPQSFDSLYALAECIKKIILSGVLTPEKVSTAEAFEGLIECELSKLRVKDKLPSNVQHKHAG